MTSFWRFARRMLRYRGMAALALLMALISAGGLGAGLVALAPALTNILSPEGRPLPELARDLNSRLAATPIRIPESLIVAFPTDRFSAVLWIICAIGALTIIGATANFLHAYLAQTLATRVVTGIRRDAFRRVVHLPLRTILADGPTDIVSRIVNDSLRLTSGMLALVDKGPAQVTKGFFAFVAAVLIDWRSLAAVPVVLLLAYIIRKLGKRVRRASRGAMEAQSSLLGATNEAMQGLRVVKVFTRERYELGRFSRHNREFMRQSLRARTARALAGPLLETISIFIFGVAALVAAKQIIDNDMDPGTFLAALASLAFAAGSLKPLSSIVQELQASAPAANRLAELIEAEAEPSAEDDRAAGRTRLPRHARDIVFDNISFSYPGADAPAVAGVTLRVRHGETIAFVGGNGSGKTTLMSLVPRLFDPDRGRVLIDGVDLRDVSIRSLRRQIGVVTQEVVLFRGTIASNIAYGADADASMEKIEAAARLARAHEFIMQKPGGYRAHVGEQGVTLSGGQRQRIALARAFLRDPAILLLDEATSMIDAESEAQIAGAIGEFASGRTVIIVAHRLSTVVNADRIVVFDAGRIVDAGRHDELLERCDAYRTLTAAQLVAAPA